jgi:hypothetical protein
LRKGNISNADFWLRIVPFIQSGHNDFEHWFFVFEIGLRAGVTDRRGMLTPLKNLIQHLVYPEACVCSVLLFDDWTWPMLFKVLMWICYKINIKQLHNSTNTWSISIAYTLYNNIMITQIFKAFLNNHYWPFSVF